MKSFIQPRPWLAVVIGLTSALSCVTVSAQTAPPFPGKAITMVVQAFLRGRISAQSSTCT